MKNLLDTKTSNLSEILGNGKRYKVPDFQRDYSWTEDKWQDLWEDMINIEIEKTEHYMGTIVLQNTNEHDVYKVVDGQQRLTTLSIIIISIIDFLNDLIKNNIEIEKNRERISMLKGYLGKKDLSSLFYSTKLELNRNNNSFYKTYILEYIKPANLSKLKNSERLIYSAFVFFKDEFKRKFSQDTGENITKFFEDVIARKLIFIQINVDNDLNAYTVFETLNARGVDLTPADLLKNYLFMLVSSDGNTLGEIQELWQNIIDLIELNDFPVFLRYFINSRYPLVRIDKLYREVKKIVQTPSQVLELLRDLKETAYLYIAIKNPHDDFWNDHPHKKEIQKSLEELKLFGVSQPIPLLFSIYDKRLPFFSDILKYICILTFRYNVIGKLNPNELEKIYNTISQQIFSGIIQTKQEIVQMFSSIYVSDNNFENAFESKIISTKQGKKIVKYILIKIENYLSGNEYDFEDSNITIEHILPENYTESWKNIFGDEVGSYVYRLGNYTLLKESENRGIGNKDFEEKNKIYIHSSYKISSEKLQYDEWNIQNLIKRQKDFSRIAKSIWSIHI